MNKLQIVLFILGSFTQIISAQKYYTKEGKVNFLSKAPLEKIEAFNSKASSVLDVSTANIEFAVLIKAFKFEKALMQEHFNENYMESSIYPKSTFKGKISNMKDINLSKDGEYVGNITGNLELHGVTQPISTKAKFSVQAGKIKATSTLKIKVADYKISIPSVVADKIAKEVEISIEANYESLK